jgi:hypothetical protein
MSNSFKKPPLSREEKDKKTEDFINFVQENKDPAKGKLDIQLSKKEPTKSLLIRVPESFRFDLQEIMNLTGLSLNSVCLELLRPAIKRKLKELKED